METALIILVAFLGIATLLTLAMVNLISFFALREILKPQQAAYGFEETGVEEITPEKKSEFEKYQEALDALMEEVDLTEEDLIAGLGGI